MKREMRKFHDVVVQWGPERNVKKSVMHMQSRANLLVFLPFSLPKIPIINLWT